MWTFKDYKSNWITWYSQEEYDKLGKELEDLKKKYKELTGDNENVV